MSLRKAKHKSPAMRWKIEVIKKLTFSFIIESAQVFVRRKESEHLSLANKANSLHTQNGYVSTM
ncbi:hypothetical protein TU51_10300 [Bacillus cytotoxicus]|nr:hypothetical protein TU51_10300 [Bacillus cytotoxicus]